MSTVSRSVIKNTDNVTVSGNEILYTHQINRNIRKLIENDERLNELFERVNGSVTVREYIENYSYEVDDLIWFFDETIEKLKILRCLKSGNTDKPYFKNGSYEGSGWMDENEDADITSFGIDKLVQRLINGKLISHETNTDQHKYGSLKNYKTDVDAILMTNDLANRNRNRDTNFYPYRNQELNADNTIITGFYRKYDTGLIEYDIVFRLGYRGTEIVDGVEYDLIRCNDMETDAYGENYNAENDRYFYGEIDKSIFSYQNGNSKNYSITDTTIERNRNDYVNVYGGTITFPVRFKDTNYMVFTNDVLAYDRDMPKGKIEPCANSITFMNRHRDHISPMLVTFGRQNFSNGGYNSTNGSLVANRFHCKIIGLTNE